MHFCRFFDWSVSYPTAAHFIGYYNDNCFQQDGQSDAEGSGDRRDLSPPSPDLTFGLDSTGASDLLDDMGSDFDLNDISGISDCDLEGWDSPTLPHGSHTELLQFQLEEVTASLLEKALRGESCGVVITGHVTS